MSAKDKSDKPSASKADEWEMRLCIVGAGYVSARAARLQRRRIFGPLRSPRTLLRWPVAHSVIFLCFLFLCRLVDRTQR